MTRDLGHVEVSLLANYDERMICNACAQPLPDGARFCVYCGNSVDAAAFVETAQGERPRTQLIRCPDCAGMVSDDALACPTCGKIIGRPALQRLQAEQRRREEERMYRQREAAGREQGMYELRNRAKLRAYLRMIPFFAITASYLVYRLFTLQVTCTDVALFVALWMVLILISAIAGDRAKRREYERQLQAYGSAPPL